MLSASEIIFPKGYEKKVLLHSCCAPCSAYVIQLFLNSGIDTTILFYNPNIYPKEEYITRKNELMLYADRAKVKFVDCDYDAENWRDAVRGLELEPEKGRRCDACFLFRLNYAANYAYNNGFKVFTSSFGISKWKDIEQVNRNGLMAASNYKDIMYWDYNWKLLKCDKKIYEISKEEGFYMQKYCGCQFSMKNVK